MDNQEKLSQFRAFTGADPVAAASFLEMAGSDVDLAIGLYLECTQAQPPQESISNASSEIKPTTWGPSFLYDIVVDKGNNELPLSDSWLQQGLQFSSHAGELVGLVQRGNGPCGALVAINALLIADRLKNGALRADEAFTEVEIGQTIASVLLACCCADDQSHVRLCSWESNPRDGRLSWYTVERNRILKTVTDRLNDFRQDGGLLLLLFSCIETRGASRIKADIIESGGETPLICGRNLLCTSELVNIFLTGRANGVVGQQPTVKGNNSCMLNSEIGLLSSTAKQAGISLNKVLKSPRLPIWILHSQEHFTLLFGETREINEESPLKLNHYNGLSPGGPRNCQILLTWRKNSHDTNETDKYFKPLPGEIEDIVQADQDDKKSKPGLWTTWRYECVLAIDDPSVSGNAREDMPPPAIFPQGPEPDSSTPWRCSTCYRSRFSTMCFGQNAPGSTTCAYCGLSRRLSGWTIWLHFDQLPITWKRKMNDRYSPPILTLLQTKWPDCSIELLDSSRKEDLTLPSA